jgi:hypothetical protein
MIRRGFLAGATSFMLSRQAFAQTREPSIENGIIELEGVLRDFYRRGLGITVRQGVQERFLQLYNNQDSLNRTEQQDMFDLYDMDHALTQLASGNLQRQDQQTRLAVGICLLRNTVNVLHDIERGYFQQGENNLAFQTRQTKNALNTYYQRLDALFPVNETSCRREMRNFSRRRPSL